MWGIMTSASTSTSTSTFEDVYLFVIRGFMCFKVYVCTKVFYVFKVAMKIYCICGDVLPPPGCMLGIMTSSASTSTSTFEDEYLFVIRGFMCFKVYVCI